MPSDTPTQAKEWQKPRLPEGRPATASAQIVTDAAMYRPPDDTENASSGLISPASNVERRSRSISEHESTSSKSKKKPGCCCCCVIL